MKEFDTFVSLGIKTQSLPTPRSYFRGADIGAVDLPQNLILFHRNHSRQLRSENQFHYRFVLVVNLQQAGTIVLDHRPLPFRPGEALLIFPHQFHLYRDLEGDDLRWLFVTFELTRHEALEPLRSQARRLSPACYSALEQLVDSYQNWRGGGGRKAMPTLGLLTSLVLFELLEQESGNVLSSPSYLPAAVEGVSRHVLENFGKDLNPDALAYQFHLSASHLRFLFRKHMRMSLGAYVQNVRLTKARSFLVASDKNVSQVATDCGYDSLVSFSRAFKKETGLSPLAYRRLNAPRS